MTKKVLASVRLHGTDYTVEIKHVFYTGDGRKVAHVEALPINGRPVQPFDHYSIGGGYSTATANIRPDFLHGIHEVDTTPAPAQVPQVAPVVKPEVIAYAAAQDGRDVAVKVLSVYQDAAGEKIAEIRALPVDGKPIRPFMNYSSERGTPWTDTIRTQLENLKGLNLAELQGVLQ